MSACGCRKESYVNGNRRAGFKYSLNRAGDKTWGKEFFNRNYSWGWAIYFGKPWEEVVCPDSPYFPDGVLAGR